MLLCGCGKAADAAVILFLPAERLTSLRNVETETAHGGAELP